MTCNYSFLGHVQPAIQRKERKRIGSGEASLHENAFYCRHIASLYNKGPIQKLLVLGTSELLIASSKKPQKYTINIVLHEPRSGCDRKILRLMGHSC